MSQSFLSAKFYSSSASSFINDIVSDNSGNTFSTGFFYNNISFDSITLASNSNSSNGFLIKSDGQGTLQWAVSMRSPSMQSNAIEITLDGSLYVAGWFKTKLIIGNDSIVSTSQNNTFIAKFSNSGNLLWMKHFNGAGVPSSQRMNINNLTKDNQGNIYYTGYFESQIIFQNTTLTSSGTSDGFFGKINASGNSIWFKKFGGNYSGTCGLPNNDSGNSIFIDNLGNLFLAGHYAFNFNLGGQTLTGTNDIDSFFAKADTSGNIDWIKSINGNGVQTISSITADALGNPILLLSFQLNCYINGDTLQSNTQFGSPYDFVILKYNSSGNIIWYRQEGYTAGNDNIKVAVSDNSGNIYIYGNFADNTEICDSLLTTYPNWTDKIYVASYNSNGNPNFVVQCGGQRNYPGGMTLNQNEDIILAGCAELGTFSGINFGAFSCNEPGTFHPFIVTLENPTLGAGIKFKSKSEPFTIFPNPTCENVNIIFDSSLSKLSYSISDNTGRICLSGTLTLENKIIDLRNLAQGIYILRLENDMKQAYKIIKL